MVLHEKGLGFETFEVNLENKSEGFLRVSPTDKVPVAVVDGDPLYGSKRRRETSRRGCGGV